MKKAKIGVASTRCRLRSRKMTLSGNGPMAYLMRRDIRINDNWSLLRCQEEARPIRVVHILEKEHPSYRLAWFYFQGLNEVKDGLGKLKIPLDVLSSLDDFDNYLKQMEICGVVTDMNPLREYDLKQVLEICEELTIPLWEVDSHNIVPVWEASDKQEYAARTIRPKINKKLNEYLIDFPPPSSNPSLLEELKGSVDIFKVLKKRWGHVEKPEINFKPGEVAGKGSLSKFLGRFAMFEKHRNDPTKEAISGLSPWLHHGHLSKQRVAFEAKKKSKSDGFIEELVVRGELAENYVFYNSNYDNLDGAPAFGKKTLEDHAGDKREYIYSYAKLESAETHDRLWNAAQNQLVKDGKMHGFMRMYWAKKILEWTRSPKQALEFTIKLNDTYALDGRDPRGYVGIMWSITGLHDQGWKERPIFGKVRYMNFEGCKRKFDIEEYIRKHK